MSEVIKIKKGLNINLQGKAEKVFIKAGSAKAYAVKPTDFPGLTPKLSVNVGDEVKAGSPLFFDKYKPEIKFTSPLSGKVQEIIRGERRKILEVVIESDGKQESLEFIKGDPQEFSKEDIINNLLKSGLWPAFIQRPYAIIANPEDTPKSIFISAFDSSPLGVDYDFILQDSKKELQAGVSVLNKLTSGKVHITINGNYPVCPVIKDLKKIQVNKFTGKHPAGNVGTHIHYIDPIDKGDIVWTLTPQNVVSIGRLFLTGKYDASKIVAVAGSEILKPRYYKLINGSSIEPLVKENVSDLKARYISGNVLTGSKISSKGYIGYYDSQLCVIPEGDEYEFFGWAAPGFNKFSLSRTFFSWLAPGKEYKINANYHGGKRALMITGNFEKVFPLDIFPMQLLKAIIIEDIDLMEKLGIYEVAEEDFALCEFVDTSKTEIQAIVRKGLDLMVKEMN